MTHHDRAGVIAKVDSVIAIVSRYAPPTTPPAYMPPPDAKLDELIDRLAKI